MLLFDYLCFMEERLDKLLISRNLVANRTEAEKLIRETGVLVNGKFETKTGKRFDLDSIIEIPKNNWISKHALKLQEAISKWKLNLSGKYVADFGCGIGGSIQVYLREKVNKIYAIDRVENSLDSSIKDEPSVKKIYKPFRELKVDDIETKLDFAILDIEDQILKDTIPFIQSFFNPHALLVCSIKPQVEITDKKVNKGGFVKLKANVLDTLISHVKVVAKNNNMDFIDFTYSPFLHHSGNHELLVLLEKRE